MRGTLVLEVGASRRRPPGLRARKRTAHLILAAHAADNQEIRAAMRSAAAGRRRDLVGVLWLLLGICYRLLRNPTAEQAEAEIELARADLVSDR